METDGDFFDSDYDAQDGDDDMFDANIDKEVNDHNERVDIIEQEDDAGLEHEDLHLSREEALELKYRFTEFKLTPSETLFFTSTFTRLIHRKEQDLHS